LTVSADRSAGATAIVDHHRLTKRAGDTLADDAADDVGIAARRERHDQMDRPLRIGGESRARQ
jgi:hypothetical protein